MNVELKPDFEVNDASCKECTGKSLQEWSAVIDAASPANRREAIQHVYGEIGAKDVWWPTTIWVEHEKTKGVVQKDGRGEGYNICVTKSVAAPLDKVYGAWSDGLSDWFGDGASYDGSEAGTLKDANGNGGQMLRVRKDKDLRLTWNTAGSPDASQVDVMFADNKGKTGITLTHARIQSRAEADGLRRAWGEAFDRLKKKLEG